MYVLVNNGYDPEYADQDEIDDIREDMMEEMGLYGQIEKMEFINGKILVEFESKNDAKKAALGLNGRWFAGRKLNAKVVSRVTYLSLGGSQRRRSRKRSRGSRQRSKTKRRRQRNRRSRSRKRA